VIEGLSDLDVLAVSVSPIEAEGEGVSVRELVSEKLVGPDIVRLRVPVTDLDPGCVGTPEEDGRTVCDSIFDGVLE